MASRLVSFWRVVFPSSAGTSGALVANSWAVIALWRRYFRQLEEEAEQRQELLRETWDEAQHVPRDNETPITSRRAKEEQREFRRDGIQAAKGGPSRLFWTSGIDTTAPASLGESETQQVDSDLQHMTLAQ